MLELDVMLERYVNYRYRSATPEVQAKFDDLLSYPDQQLFDWLVKREPADSAVQNIIDDVINNAKIHC